MVWIVDQLNKAMVDKLLNIPQCPLPGESYFSTDLGCSLWDKRYSSKQLPTNRNNCHVVSYCITGRQKISVNFKYREYKFC